MKKKLIFSSFWLKVFALFFMTIDHIGLLLTAIPNAPYSYFQASEIMRSIGRLAMPLFIFMIVEGVLHTKSFKKYIIRLGIFAALISIALICVTYINTGYDATELTGAGNIFLDLSLTAVAIYFINRKEIPLKLITLLPLAISIISFCVKQFEYSTGGIVYWYPNWLYLQYDWVGVVLGIGYYFAKKLANVYTEYFSNCQSIDRYVLDYNGTTQIASNILSLVGIAIVFIIQYFSGSLNEKAAFWDYKTQLYGIISGAFILLYNGKRGYNAKWFQYGSYLYYPLSILVLIVAYLIIGG